MDGGLCAACLAVGGAGMLHKLTAFAQTDGRKLMDLYQEGNRENAPYFFPEIKEQALALKKVEQRFLEYVETDFSAEMTANTGSSRKTAFGSAPCGSIKSRRGFTIWRPWKPIRILGKGVMLRGCWQA